ncbi:MAG: hypothetical protein IPM97_01920 [Bdellovibrionaceae bacterium]|nr:hypothetical protein [Pseudobdellovibrionaceae bacterium]
MKFIFIITLVTASAFISVHAQVKPDMTAGDLTAAQSNAKKLYERITGTKLPADSPLISQMANLIQQGNSLGAAKLATQDPNFYNITVKLMALPLSTREESLKSPLTDFVAGFIGVTRDDRDARELLTGNFYYRGSGANVRSDIVADILNSNNHYDDLERTRADLSTNLVRVEGQVLSTSATTTVANPDPAGVLTSRGFMGAHALMGTNRRLVEYTFREFMCVPLNMWADTGASDLRIGRDIDRFPSGDHTKFLTSCKGCHTVQDGFRGAFAKWDFSGTGGLKNSAVHTRGDGGGFTIAADTRGVVNKMNKNNTVFPSGYVMIDSSFVNNAIRPANAALFGWRGNALSGTGVKDFGTVVSNSSRFSQCMAKRVFETVCRKILDETKSRDALIKWGTEFEASGYKLKSLFESMSVKPECLN